MVEGTQCQLHLGPPKTPTSPQWPRFAPSSGGDKTFWTDRITWYLRGEHSPQQALPERAAFVAVDEGKLVGFVAGHSRVDSVAGVKQRRASADGWQQRLYSIVRL